MGKFILGVIIGSVLWMPFSFVTTDKDGNCMVKYARYDHQKTLCDKENSNNE